MQTSILWEGSLPSKEEIEHMKREGYQFRSVDGGWKICLKLHNTPTGRWFADSFSKSFSKEVELHRYLEQVEKHAIWFEVPSKKLRVYEVGQLLESPKGEDECICMEVLKDTKNHSHLLLKTDKEEVYQLGSSAISTLENRARISGAALSNVRPAVLAEILNQCLKGKHYFVFQKERYVQYTLRKKMGIKYIPYQKYLCLPVFTYAESIKRAPF